VRTLLDCGVSAELGDGESWSMIHWAAHYGSLAAVEEFISREEVAIDVRSRDGFTPLCIASRDGRSDIVQPLLDSHRVDPN
ncbi:hypothetical protein B9Z19DRAFT_951060, partial [Tuber borchii]